MKILAIGDMHGVFPKSIPKKVDAILLTGDIGKADLARAHFFENIKRKKEGLEERELTPEEAKAIHLEIHDSTINSLRRLSQIAPVYTITGNVGIPGASHVNEDYEKYGIKIPSTLGQIKKMKDISIVKNRLRVFGGVRIGFLEYFVDTCWVNEFSPSDFQKQMKKAKQQTEKAKRVLKNFRDIDILLCHQPPYSVLDKVDFPGIPKSWKGKHAGSKAILDYVKQHQPRYVFCGHIHEGVGMKKIGKTEVYNLGIAKAKVVDI